MMPFSLEQLGRSLSQPGGPSCWSAGVTGVWHRGWWRLGMPLGQRLPLGAT